MALNIDKYISEIRNCDGTDEAIAEILKRLIRERDDEWHWLDWDFD